jgi:hypothetical protein
MIEFSCLIAFSGSILLSLMVTPNRFIFSSYQFSLVLDTHF